MYVPPIVARKIEAEGIEPGELFELCKAQVKNGRLRSIEWWLKRSSAEPLNGKRTEKPSEPQTDLEPQLLQSIEAVNGDSNGSHPTAQNDAIQNSSLQSSPSPPVPATKLEHALKTAISAAYSAEKFGTDLGYVVRFDADAIKSMAITVLINMTEGGRR